MTSSSFNDTTIDHQLVLAFKQGEEHAFDQLVERHKDKIVRLCYRYLLNYEDACECAQDAFTKAYFALHQFKGGSSFSTWIYKIAVNVCQNRLSSLQHKNQKKHLDLSLTANHHHNLFEITDNKPLPLDSLIRQEQEQFFQYALRHLSEEERSLIVLRYIEDMPYAEICDISGLQLGTVKSKLNRAKNKLIHILKRTFADAL